MSELSVVIPTYNRCQILDKAISAYLRQTAGQSIAEMIVVDDGSTDVTKEVVTKWSQTSSIPIRYFRQENKGPAAARNVGIGQARGDLILFTDDDILPAPNLVSEHLNFHRRSPEFTTAVLGRVNWADEVQPTPFMNWYGSDFLFAYGSFIGRTELDYPDFYSCNVSLKTAFLRRHGFFDEEFKSAAYEDIELGYRLKKAGMRLVYNPQALGHHHQFISFEDACRRAQKASVAEQVFRNKEAGLDFAARQCLRSPLAAQGSPGNATRLRSVKKYLAWLLAPLKTAMDCRVPLPWTIYRTMLRIYR